MIYTHQLVIIHEAIIKEFYFGSFCGMPTAKIPLDIIAVSHQNSTKVVKFGK